MAVSSEPFVLPRTGIAVANRCLLAAMTNKQSHEDGSLSDEEIHWLTMRAKGGFGIVTTAAANVTETGRGWDGEMGVWGDHQLPGLTKMAEGLRAHGALSLVQIFHGGMRAPQSINGVQPVSASVNTEAGMDGSTRALSALEVEDMVEAFADAAVRCEQAGFDGVELHGAHSYLICQFLGTETNRRQDEWGGSYEARKRFLWAIIEAVRARTSPNFLVFVRISPLIEKMGIHLEESLQLAQDLVKADVDGLHISCWDVFQEVDDADERLMTKRFADVLPDDFPLISTGGVWSAKDAQFVMDEGAHFVGVGRVAIGHSDWARHIGDVDYDPQRAPFTAEHLSKEGLSPVFIDYMRRWKNFVV